MNKTRPDIIRAAQTQGVAVRCRFTWIKNGSVPSAPIDFDVDHTFGPAAPMWGTSLLNTGTIEYGTGGTWK